MPGRVVLEREHRGRGGVVEVDERRDAAALADDRELALAHRLEQPVVGGAVEAAVAQRDPAGVVTASSRYRIAALVSRVVATGVGSSGSSSVLTGPPSRAYRKLAKLWATKRRTPASRAAATSASVPSVRSRLVCANVRSRLLREPHVGQRGRLVDDRVGPRGERRPRSRRRASSRSSTIGSAPSARTRSAFRGRPGGADHLVPALDQLRHQPGADRTARSCDEDSASRFSLSVSGIAGLL